MKNYKIIESVKWDGSKAYSVFEIITHLGISVPIRRAGASRRERADDLAREAKIRSETTTCEYRINIPNNIQTIEEIKTYLKSKTVVETNIYNINI